MNILKSSVFALQAFLLCGVIGTANICLADESIFEAMLPPSDQAKNRQEHTYTVGLPTTAPYDLPSHVQYRPRPSIALGLSYTVDKFEDDETTTPLSHGRELKADVTSASAYVQYFPGKGGFYVGLGVEQREGSYSILKRKNWSPVYPGDDWEMELTGRYKALYAGPSFGWSWIWSNGITFGVDLSQRKRHQMWSGVTSGRSDMLNTLVSETKDELYPETRGGTIMLGYSF